MPIIKRSLAIAGDKRHYFLFAPFGNFRRYSVIFGSDRAANLGLPFKDDRCSDVIGINSGRNISVGLDRKDIKIIILLPFLYY